MRMILDNKKIISEEAKNTIKDYEEMSESEFVEKYRITKGGYFDRIRKFGKPYVNRNLQRVAKYLGKAGFKG